LRRRECPLKGWKKGTKKNKEKEGVKIYLPRWE
jgi:hypothetical protein